MHAVENLNDVRAKIERAARKADRDPATVDLVAVSKTFDAETIRPVLETGHRLFGENKVQEAQSKWPDLRKAFDGIELHLIGPLQSNKAADAVAVFDVIESVDREKIARVLAAEMEKQNRRLPVFVQVNTGEEPQKAGVSPSQTVRFVASCRETYGLNVVGLMAIPPFDAAPGPHFALLRKLAREAGVEKLSMGMSGDYDIAIAFGATSVRIGSAIFGAREKR